jgi:hypothetical protein
MSSFLAEKKKKRSRLDTQPITRRKQDEKSLNGQGRSGNVQGGFRGANNNP